MPAARWPLTHHGGASEKHRGGHTGLPVRRECRPISQTHDLRVRHRDEATVLRDVHVLATSPSGAYGGYARPASALDAARTAGCAPFTTGPSPAWGQAGHDLTCSLRRLASTPVRAHAGAAVAMSCLNPTVESHGPNMPARRVLTACVSADANARGLVHGYPARLCAPTGMRVTSECLSECLHAGPAWLVRRGVLCRAVRQFLVGIQITAGGSQALTSSSASHLSGSDFELQLVASHDMCYQAAVGDLRRTRVHAFWHSEPGNPGNRTNTMLVSGGSQLRRFCCW